MALSAQNDSFTSIVRKTPIDLNKRAQDALRLANSPVPHNETRVRDLRETMRLRYRAEIFTRLASHLAIEENIPNGIATIDQMEDILRNLITLKVYRTLAILLSDTGWRKIIKEVKHDIVATALETVQAHVQIKGKTLPETRIAMTFTNILHDISHPDDVEEEDFL